MYDEYSTNKKKALPQRRRRHVRSISAGDPAVTKGQHTSPRSFLALNVVPVRRTKDLIELSKGLDALFQRQLELSLGNELPAQVEGLLRVLQSLKALKTRGEKEKEKDKWSSDNKVGRHHQTP